MSNSTRLVLQLVLRELDLQDQLELATASLAAEKHQASTARLQVLQLYRECFAEKQT